MSTRMTLSRVMMDWSEEQGCQIEHHHFFANDSHPHVTTQSPPDGNAILLSFNLFSKSLSAHKYIERRWTTKSQRISLCSWSLPLPDGTAGCISVPSKQLTVNSFKFKFHQDGTWRQYSQVLKSRGQVAISFLANNMQLIVIYSCLQARHITSKKSRRESTSIRRRTVPGRQRQCQGP